MSARVSLWVPESLDGPGRTRLRRQEVLLHGLPPLEDTLPPLEDNDDSDTVDLFGYQTKKKRDAPVVVGRGPRDASIAVVDAIAVNPPPAGATSYSTTSTNTTTTIKDFKCHGPAAPVPTYATAAVNIDAAATHHSETASTTSPPFSTNTSTAIVADFGPSVEADAFALDRCHVYTVARGVLDMLTTTTTVNATATGSATCTASTLPSRWRWQWERRGREKEEEEEERVVAAGSESMDESGCVSDSGAPLRIVAHAGERTDATYSRQRRGIVFCYRRERNLNAAPSGDGGGLISGRFPSEGGGGGGHSDVAATETTANSSTATTYWCRATDVVAHEVAHAVLDALRPDLLDAMLAQHTTTTTTTTNHNTHCSNTPSLACQIPALHEAFADLSAVFFWLRCPLGCAEVLQKAAAAVRPPPQPPSTSAHTTSRTVTPDSRTPLDRHHDDHHHPCYPRSDLRRIDCITAVGAAYAFSHNERGSYPSIATQRIDDAFNSSSTSTHNGAPPCPRESATVPPPSAASGIAEHVFGVRNVNNALTGAECGASPHALADVFSGFVWDVVVALYERSASHLPQPAAQTVPPRPTPSSLSTTKQSATRFSGGGTSAGNTGRGVPTTTRSSSSAPMMGRGPRGGGGGGGGGGAAATGAVVGAAGRPLGKQPSSTTMPGRTRQRQSPSETVAAPAHTNTSTSSRRYTLITPSRATRSGSAGLGGGARPPVHPTASRTSLSPLLLLAARAQVLWRVTVMVRRALVTALTEGVEGSTQHLSGPHPSAVGRLPLPSDFKSVATAMALRLEDMAQAWLLLQNQDQDKRIQQEQQTSSSRSRSFFAAERAVFALRPIAPWVPPPPSQQSAATTTTRTAAAAAPAVTTAAAMAEKDEEEEATAHRLAKQAVLAAVTSLCAMGGRDGGQAGCRRSSSISSGSAADEGYTTTTGTPSGSGGWQGLIAALCERRGLAVAGLRRQLRHAAMRRLMADDI